MNNQTKKVTEICRFNIQNGCREVCPLLEACVYIEGDTQEVFNERMNEAADNVEFSGDKNA